MSYVHKPLGDTGCAKMGKKAHRMMGSQRRDRGSPAYGQLWTDKEFYKSEKGDNNEGLHYNKRLTRYVYAIYT